MGNTGDPVHLRRTVYALLIALATAAGLGRILSASLVYDPTSFRDPAAQSDSRKPWPKDRPAPTPMFSSNDRSRWATVRSLVDEGTYVIGQRRPDEPGGINKFGDRGIIFEDGWTSVDKVLHPETHDFYSSKPPLLSTLVAGEYWLLKHGLGWSIARNPEWVVRTILIVTNLIPFAIYLILLSRLVERFGQTDWGRFFVLSAAGFATLVTPFLDTFNNHTLGTCFALFALYAGIEIWTQGCAITPTPTLPHQGGGLFSSLPHQGGGLFSSLPHQGGGLSGSLPPCGGGLGWGVSDACLYAIAGLCAGFTVTWELPAGAFSAALALLLGYRSPRKTLAYFLPASALPVLALVLTNYLAVGQIIPVYSKLNTPWYQYEGSHWQTVPGEIKRGIDYLNDPKWLYAFHLLLGHHGLFSLTPVFLFSIAGMWMGSRQRRAGDVSPLSEPTPARDSSGGSRPPLAMPRFLFPLTAFLTLLMLIFYIAKTNNYGGGTCGPRWLMWLTPFLLLTMLPAVDRLAEKRWGRLLAYAFLGISVVSAVYPMQNPWKHPWIWDFMVALGWTPY